MEGKKAFILYSDLLPTVDQLPDEVAGRLLKHILEYVNDKNPETDELLVKIAFEPIRQQLKRDLIKWEQRAQNSRLNGKKGGRPTKEEAQENPNKPGGLNKNPGEPGKPGNVNVNVSVKDNVKETNNKKKPATREVENLINNSFETNYNLGIKFNEWFNYRKEIKKTLKATTVKAQIKFLKKYTPEIAIKIIEQSILHGWTGLHELKQAGPGNQQNPGQSQIEKMSGVVQSANEKLNNLDLK